MVYDSPSFSGSFFPFPSRVTIVQKKGGLTGHVPVSVVPERVLSHAEYAVYDATEGVAQLRVDERWAK